MDQYTQTGGNDQKSTTNRNTIAEHYLNKLITKDTVAEHVIEPHNYEWTTHIYCFEPVK